MTDYKQCKGHQEERNAKCGNCTPMWSNARCEYYVPDEEYGDKDCKYRQQAFGRNMCSELVEPHCSNRSRDGLINKGKLVRFCEWNSFGE